MSASGNILSETLSEAQQNAAADACTTPVHSSPKLPKSQQEEKNERTAKIQNA